MFKRDDADLYDAANLACWLAKAGAAAEATIALAGRFVVTSDNWGLLSVPNAIVRGFYAALDEPGTELPLKGDVLNAHITVFRPEDVARIGGADKIKERGQSFKYQTGAITVVEPRGWHGISKCWMLSIKSLALETLRKSYGLPPLPNGDHPFHCTIAVRRRNVLRNNAVSKAAASLDFLENGHDDGEARHVKIKVDAGDGRFLLHHYIRADEWDHPAGRIEDGEEPVDAAVRELHERTGHRAERAHLKSSGVDGGFHVFAVPLSELVRTHKPGEAGGYSTRVKIAAFEPGECCPACDTPHERSNDGFCNSCGAAWPEAVKESSLDELLSGTRMPGAGGRGEQDGVRGAWQARSPEGIPAGDLRLPDDLVCGGQADAGGLLDGDRLSKASAALELDELLAKFSALDVKIDRPKGFKKLFNTSAGKREVTYPTDYGYFDGRVNPQDGEGADVFVGTGGPHHGRYMKGNVRSGKWKPDEHKWFTDMNDGEYDAMYAFYEDNDAKILRNKVKFKDRAALEADVLKRTSAGKAAAAIDGLIAEMEKAAGLKRTVAGKAAAMQRKRPAGFPLLPVLAGAGLAAGSFALTNKATQLKNQLQFKPEAANALNTAADNVYQSRTPAEAVAHYTGDFPIALNNPIYGTKTPFRIMQDMRTEGTPIRDAMPNALKDSLLFGNTFANIASTRAHYTGFARGPNSAIKTLSREMIGEDNAGGIIDAVSAARPAALEQAARLVHDRDGTADEFMDIYSKLVARNRVPFDPRYEERTLGGLAPAVDAIRHGMNGREIREFMPRQVDHLRQTREGYAQLARTIESSIPPERSALSYFARSKPLFDAGTDTGDDSAMTGLAQSMTNKTDALRSFGMSPDALAQRASASPTNRAIGIGPATSIGASASAAMNPPPPGLLRERLLANIAARPGATSSNMASQAAAVKATMTGTPEGQLAGLAISRHGGGLPVNQAGWYYSAMGDIGAAPGRAADWLSRNSTPIKAIGAGAGIGLAGLAVHNWMNRPRKPVRGSKYDRDME